MNGTFASVLTLPEQGKREVFQALASRLDRLPPYLEKNFGVGLVLDAPCNRLLDGHPKPIFKRAGCFYPWEKLPIRHDVYYGHRDAERLPTNKDRTLRRYDCAAMITATETDRPVLSTTGLPDVEPLQHAEAAINGTWPCQEETLQSDYSINLAHAEG